MGPKGAVADPARGARLFDVTCTGKHEQEVPPGLLILTTPGLHLKCLYAAGDQWEYDEKTCNWRQVDWVSGCDIPRTFLKIQEFSPAIYEYHEGHGRRRCMACNAVYDRVHPENACSRLTWTALGSPRSAWACSACGTGWEVPTWCGRRPFRSSGCSKCGSRSPLIPLAPLPAQRAALAYAALMRRALLCEVCAQPVGELGCGAHPKAALVSGSAPGLRWVDWRVRLYEHLRVYDDEPGAGLALLHALPAGPRLVHDASSGNVLCQVHVARALAHRATGGPFTESEGQCAACALGKAVR